MRRARSIATVVRVCAAAGAAAVAGCHEPINASPPSNVAWDVKNVDGYIQTAKGEPDTAFAWDLRFAGGIARWRECPTTDACGNVEHEQPASEVLAVQQAGKARGPDGNEVEVVRLSLAPRRKYTTPP